MANIHASRQYKRYDRAGIQQQKASSLHCCIPRYQIVHHDHHNYKTHPAPLKRNAYATGKLRTNRTVMPSKLPSLKDKEPCRRDLAFGSYEYVRSSSMSMLQDRCLKIRAAQLVSTSEEFRASQGHNSTTTMQSIFQSKRCPFVFMDF